MAANIPTSANYFDFLAPPLILLAPPIHFITYHQYDFFRTEIIELLLGLVAVGVLIGAVMRLAGPLIRILIMATLVVYFFEIQLDINSATLTLIVALAACWAVRGRLAEIASYMALVFIALTLILPSTGDVITTREGHTAVSYDPDLPPILHIIADAHVGIEGIPTDIDPGMAVKSQLLDGYIAHGFTLYGNAFSQYLNTYNSISNTLNFSSKDIDGYYFGPEKNTYLLKDNVYLEALTERGYRIRIYQSDYMDYCLAPKVAIVSCVTHAGNTIKSIEDLPLQTSQKRRFIFSSMLKLSSALTDFRRFYAAFRKRVIPVVGERLPYWKRPLNRVGPLPTMPMFSMLRSDIRADPGGTVFFAHLKIPHDPFVFDKDCSLVDDIRQWQVAQEPGDSEARALAYSRYLEQVLCLDKQFNALIGVIRDTGRYDDWTIVIHGDHSSRIYLVAPIAKYADRLVTADYIGGFSTLFAVKQPGALPGYDRQPASLSDLLGTVLKGDAQSNSGDQHILLLDDKDGRMVRHRMPFFSDD